jgi:hypothetical protein
MFDLKEELRKGSNDKVHEGTYSFIGIRKSLSIRALVRATALRLPVAKQEGFSQAFSTWDEAV